MFLIHTTSKCGFEMPSKPKLIAASVISLVVVAGIGAIYLTYGEHQFPGTRHECLIRAHHAL